MQYQPHKIKYFSERIRDEFIKILMSPGKMYGLWLLKDTLLEQIIPELLTIGRLRSGSKESS